VPAKGKGPGAAAGAAGKAWAAGLGILEGAHLHGYEEHATGQGSDASALAWVELGAPGVGPSVYGAGWHPNLVTASLHALVQAINRLQMG